MSVSTAGGDQNLAVTLPEAPVRPSRTGIAVPVDGSREEASRTSALALFAGFVAFLLPVVADPAVGSDTFTPKYLVMLLVGAVGAVPLYRLARSGPLRLTARLGVAFLFVAALSAALSAVPVVGFFGTYLWGTGWFFWLACIGGWAIGATLDERGRRVLFNGLLAGVMANALLAIAQVFGTKYDPSLFTAGLLQTFDGQADGFLGNPIHLEALLMGGLALVLGRTCRKPWPWALWAAIIAMALELSAERLAPILLLGLAAYAIWRYPWRRALIYIGSVAAGYVLGSLTGTLSVVNRTVDLGAARTTYGLRTGIWKVGLKAALHRPLLGYGPGQFLDATSRILPLSLAKQLGPNRYFTDAHNMVLEVLVTTGFLGLVALAAFGVTSLREARGALLGFAIFLLLVRLVEPLNIGTEPLAFMALGAAAGGVAWRSWRPARTAQPAQATQSAQPEQPTQSAQAERRNEPAGVGARLVTAVLVLAALLLGLSLLVGDSELYQAETHFSISKAQDASRLMPEWPDSAAELAQVYAYYSILHPGQGWMVRSRNEWRVAVGRQPTAPGSWANLGQADLDLGHLQAATRAFDRSRALATYEYQALSGLAQIAMRQHRFAAALAQEQLLYSIYSLPTDKALIQQIKHDLARATSP